MNSLPVTTGFASPVSSQPLQWGNLGSQNAIITFHTLPFIEGGQEIAITETCLPTSVDLSSTANLVQSLIAQGVGIKVRSGFFQASDCVCHVPLLIVQGAGVKVLNFRLGASDLCSSNPGAHCSGKK